MANLGEFGAAKREAEPSKAVRDTFTFCGESFEVRDYIPGMLSMELGSWAVGQVSNGFEGFASCLQALRVALGEDYDRFHGLTIKHRSTEDEIIALTFVILGAQSGRPTEEPEGSSDGQPETSPSSSTSSSHPALAHLRPVSELVAG
jgi:hypothetical protein